MDKTLRIIVMFVAIMIAIKGVAQKRDGGMEGMPGTGMSVSYNKSGGNITDYFTARAAYRFLTDKHIEISANVRYHFMNADFSKSGTAAEAGRLHEMGMDGSHSVYQTGLNSFMHTSLFGKPFMAIAMLTADFSPEGFERINAMGGGMIMLTMTRKTQFGLGAFLLINTSSKWPLYPMFVYHHSFSPSLALNLYGRTFGFDYTPTKQDRLTAGFDIDSRTFYFRPDVEGLPESCRYTSTLFRPMVKYRRTLAKGLNLELEVGEEIKMSSRIYGRNGTKHYMDVKQSPRPFVMASLGYSL